MIMHYGTNSGSLAMETGVCCSRVTVERTRAGARPRSIFLQRKFKRKIRAFAHDAVDLDLSLVRIHDGLYIAKSKPEAFHIMKIAGMRTVEFFKDASLCLLAHADPIVFYPDNQAFGRTMGDDADQQVIL